MATFTGSTPIAVGSMMSTLAYRGTARSGGNVETEISRMEDIGAGCGCAYPPTGGRSHRAAFQSDSCGLKSVAQAAPRHAIACRSCRCSSSWRSPVCELASFTAMPKRLLGGAFPLRLSISRIASLARTHSPAIANRCLCVDPHLCGRITPVCSAFRTVDRDQ